MTSAKWEPTDRRRDSLNVIIIGGSLAGLMHGIVIKRLGHNVRILEQNRSSNRTNHAAGMGTGPKGFEFLKEYDLYNVQPCVRPSSGFQILDKDANIKRLIDLPITLSGWDVLYYRLRANFDAFESKYCPQPPGPLESDGNVSFELGKRATDVFYTDDLATVEFEDLIDGGGGSIHADLVLIADGWNSAIRERLLPGLPRTYSGYVGWRGTVPEREVSEETRILFNERFNAFAMDRSHVLGYAMPGENGSFEVGERLFNWCWYINCSEDSQEFHEFMTDVDGHIHRNTMPPGQIRLEVWEKIKARARGVLTPPFLELMEKTARPFISSIRDCTPPVITFFDGKLILVGEAQILMRPHSGMNFNQSAVSSLLLKRYLQGHITIEQWGREVMQSAESSSLFSTAVGTYFQFGVFGLPFILTLMRFFVASVRQPLYNVFWRFFSA